MDWSVLTTVLSILGGGGLLGLAARCLRLGMKFQDLLSRVEANEKRDIEEREKNEKKFAELFQSRNKTNETLVELTTTVKMMASTFNQQFANLNKKLDELRLEVHQ